MKIVIFAPEIYRSMLNRHACVMFSVPNQDNSSTLSNGLGTTKAPPSQNTTSYDPGGEKCDPTPTEDELVITIQVMRYTTLAVSVLFLIEVSLDLQVNTP